MMIISKQSAKCRHALVWFALMVFGGMGSILTANFSWPPRKKKVRRPAKTA